MTNNILSRRRQDLAYCFVHPILHQIYFSLPNLVYFSNAISRILEVSCEVLRVLYFSSFLLGHILCNTKDKVKELKCNGVFKLNGNDCGVSYVGQTRGKLEDSIKEHLDNHQHLATT